MKSSFWPTESCHKGPRSAGGARLTARRRPTGTPFAKNVLATRTSGGTAHAFTGPVGTRLSVDRAFDRSGFLMTLKLM
jgi:hypothetical protein